MSAFWQINLLLALTGVLFVIADKCLQIFHVKISSMRILRFTQVLFILSLLLPVLLKVLPSGTVEGVSSSTYRVYAEGFNSPLPIESVKPTEKPEAKMPTQAPDVNLQIDLHTLLIVLWILATAYSLIRFRKNYLLVKKTLLNAAPFKSFGKVRIVATADVFVPFSARLPGAAWIAIPASLLTDKKDLDLAIKHELQHHRQGDTSWAMFMEFTGCIFALNPAMALWKNIMTELQEFSCDESLTGQKEISSRDYGSCLLRVAETALHHRQMYAGTTSMAAIIKDSNYFRKFLMRRIEMITEEKVSQRTWLATGFATLTLIVSVATAIGAEKIVRGKPSVNSGEIVVDQEIQKITDDVLIRSLAKMKATAGFIIVSEPATGRILAVSNMDLKGGRKGYWVLNELMETASIAKPLVVAEAFEEGKMDLDTKHNCENGKFKYNGTEYRDWKENGWSSLSTKKVVEVSSNICMIKIGEKIGVDGLNTMFDKFGFGEGGIAANFPQARPGERPEANPQFIPQVTSGFGFKSSPIEILQAYGAIANGGTLMEPVMARDRKNGLRTVLTAENSRKLRELLENVVLKGTGKQAQSPLYTTAGKTATTLMNDFMQVDWYGTKNVANYAGFIGFAPANNPAIEVYVGMINPNTDNTGAHGGWHAAPVFREVVENVLTHMKVAPDKI